MLVERSDLFLSYESNFLNFDDIVITCYESEEEPTKLLLKGIR